MQVRKKCLCAYITSWNLEFSMHEPVICYYVIISLIRRQIWLLMCSIPINVLILHTLESSFAWKMPQSIFQKNEKFYKNCDRRPAEFKIFVPIVEIYNSLEA